MIDQVIQAAWFWVFFVLATVLVIGWILSIKAPRDNPHRMTPEEIARVAAALCREHGCRPHQVVRCWPETGSFEAAGHDQGPPVKGENGAGPLPAQAESKP